GGRRLAWWRPRRGRSEYGGHGGGEGRGRPSPVIRDDTRMAVPAIPARGPEARPPRRRGEHRSRPDARRRRDPHAGGGGRARPWPPADLPGHRNGILPMAGGPRGRPHEHRGPPHGGPRPARREGPHGAQPE